MKKYKKSIKYENIIAILYTIITLFKYFILPNANILLLILDLIIDSTIGYLIYTIIHLIRKKELFD